MYTITLDSLDELQTTSFGLSLVDYTDAGSRSLLRAYFGACVSIEGSCLVMCTKTFYDAYSKWNSWKMKNTVPFYQWFLQTKVFEDGDVDSLLAEAATFQEEVQRYKVIVSYNDAGEQTYMITRPARATRVPRENNS